MRRGNTVVEQVNIEGEIVKDLDISLSPTEMIDTVFKHVPGVEEYVKHVPAFIGEYKGCKYAIRCKNITYLGNPHPVYKKRIQISDDLFYFLEYAKYKEAKPLLFGIYTYDDVSNRNTIFVDFDLDTYIHKSAHNSSAHIYTDDLAAALEDGFFQKIDYFGNTITAIRPDVLGEYFEEVLVGTTEKFVPAKYFEKIKQDSNITEQVEEIEPVENTFEGKIYPLILDFAKKVNKNWHGINCYSEMMENQFSRKFMAEWPGTYLEYAFEKYIKENHLEDTIRFAQDKTQGGIDLDLYFPTLGSYGELKAHNVTAKGGVPGNDWDTVTKLISNPGEAGHLYLIIVEHLTEKDKDHNYEVTQFWNTAQGKSNLMSYASKMKNSVTLYKAYILDVNYSNKEYLTVFRQGRNSNGNARAPKFMISDNYFHKFLKYVIEF